MGREIKFRAFNKVTKTMGEPFTLQTAIESRKIDGVDTSEVEFMEWAGFKDKNGKDIYEGDILRYSCDEPRVKVKDVVNQVVFFRGNFSAKWSQGYLLLLELNDDLEVIGNIYESPELL